MLFQGNSLTERLINTCNVIKKNVCTTRIESGITQKILCILSMEETEDKNDKKNATKKGDCSHHDMMVHRTGSI